MSDETHLLNRRAFLRAAAASAGTLLLTACGGNSKQANNATNSGTSTAGNQQTPQQLGLQNPPTAPPETTHPTGGAGGGSPVVTSQSTSTGRTTSASTEEPVSTIPVPASFNESPKLAEQVKAGKLPKVTDRLPKNPLVLKSVEKVGTYGGDWNTTLQGPADSVWLGRTVTYDPLLRWKPDTRGFTQSDVIPNLAESYEIDRDGAEYTFKLRNGVRWSDGHPFTADDILFWYEDVLTNQEITPDFPSWLQADGKPVKVEKQDDYTVTFRFPSSNGLFPLRMAMGSGDDITTYPAHYLKQFHKKYNPKVVQQAKNAQMDSWADLFGQKASTTDNPDKPVLYAWHFTTSLGESTQQLVAERNPYYWKVDTEGNQLPYIDRVVYAMIEKEEVMLLKALNGEIDMQDRHITTTANRAVLYKSQKKGNYHFFNETYAIMNTMMIALNLTTRDKVKNKVFNDRNFRIGLSHALNRQEIIDTVFVSQGKPFQGAPRPESPFYNEKLAKQYTEYDVNKANQYLDKALPKKDAQGRRLGPDGKPFAFTVETTATPFGPYDTDVMQMVQRYWQAVGVTIDVKEENRDILYTRKGGNLADATTWTGGGGLEILIDPRWYFPYSGESNYAIPWATWFQNPKAQDAIKPPATARKQMDLYTQIQSTADQDKQIQLMKQILDIAQDQFWAIGVSLPVYGYGLVKNTFHNVPKAMVQSAVALTPEPSNPSQYFTDEK